MPPEPKASELPYVKLYTDGACRGNPGPGGWAYILKHPGRGTVREMHGSAGETTKNKMELQAVMEGLHALNRRPRVELYTDSKYVMQGCRDWIPGWKAKGWKRKNGKKLVPVKNLEQWQQLDALLSQHEIAFQHVKGHSGHPENERCDELAVAAALEVVD